MRPCHDFLVFSDIFLGIYEGGKNKASFMQETVYPLNLCQGLGGISETSGSEPVVLAVVIRYIYTP